MGSAAAGGNKLKWWQVGLISLAASLLGGLTGLRSTKKQKILYEKKLKQAPWAPPSWAFAPAWMFNNVFLVNALNRILSRDVPNKRKLLLLQGGIWFIFFTFNFVYFRKKSPLLAAFWTMSDNILATASMLTSFKSDKKTALSYLPLLLWTMFASSVADYQALKNPDPFFHSKAMLN
jgi:tryptophan-rich sensory protein